MLRILMIHNEYLQPGGEDVAVQAELRLLNDRENMVIRYQRSNKELGVRGLAAIRAGIDTVWSSSSHQALREILKAERPDIAHFHNTFPIISPSAYYACAEAGVRVVQTLHNYRLLCPGATFMRDGKVCELCLDHAVPWPGVQHGCYRDSRSATFVTAAMLSVHRALGTWRNRVDLYIALTEFARGQFIKGGLPADRIIVKPNFLADHPARQTSRGECALFVGRLSTEKGPQLLPVAWQKLQTPLRIVGDGPLLKPLREAIERDGLTSRIEVMGRRSSEEVGAAMAGARFLVMPSIWYEGFPMTVLEAFSHGVPVIASRLGSLAEIVDDGRTGLLFAPGDPQDLAAKVDWAWSNPEAMSEMGRAARREYECKYTPEHNYRMLMEIYQRAITSQASKGRVVAEELVEG